MIPGVRTRPELFLLGAGMIAISFPGVSRYVRSRRWLIVQAEDVVVEDLSGPAPAFTGTRFQPSYKYTFAYHVSQSVMHGQMTSAKYWGQEFKIRVNQKNHSEVMFKEQSVGWEVFSFFIGAGLVLMAIIKGA